MPALVDHGPPGRCGCDNGSYQALLDRESVPVPDCLRAESPADFDTAPLAAARYTCPEFFELERTRLWPRVWQMVCREEELARPGDVHVHDIVDRSFLVVRTGTGKLRAFHNVCLHRGRKLRTEGGNAPNLWCRFHGFAWTLDGEVEKVPCRWDFQHLSDDDLRLPEARVDTWGGFVFLNMDPAAPPLREYLGVLPDHFARWRLEDCWKAAHVARRLPCNWKVAMEAFMESYHVIATHPQILPVSADACAQYDVFGEHVNRNMMAFAVPSSHTSGVTDEQVIDGMLAMWGRERSRARVMEYARRRGGARAGLGHLVRESFARAFGGSYDHVTDAELLDAIVYNVFPNFSPWGGFAPNIVYRWKPDGMAVDRCVMEVMLLKRVPVGDPRPRPATVHWLADDEPWSNAKELPILGPVIDQDMDNLPYIQQGLRASANGRVHLGRYQESRIRHFHRTLDRYLAVPPGAPPGDPAPGTA